MSDTVKNMIQALKILEMKESNGADHILRQELIKINQQALSDLLASREIFGNGPIRRMLRDALYFMKVVER